MNHKRLKDIAALLTSLTKGGTMKLACNSESEEAFLKFKVAFTTASVLKHPNPGTNFIVEVDGSDTGVRAVLSQKSGEKMKMHPIAIDRFPRNSYSTC